MPIWISLLRAVNLGAHNKVPMPRLREALGKAGFSAVRTVVQSGNVVASSRHRSEASVARDVRALLFDHFGVDTPVVVRSAADFVATATAPAFPDLAARDPRFVHVVFHAAPITDPAPLLVHVEGMSEQVHVEDREVQVAYPDGAGRSKLTLAVMARLLGQEGTARNWRTVTTLAEVASGTAGG
jgi:uncharacterized protein (DUF1697 family)